MENQLNSLKGWVVFFGLIFIIAFGIIIYYQSETNKYLEKNDTRQLMHEIKNN